MPVDQMAWRPFFASMTAAGRNGASYLHPVIFAPLASKRKKKTFQAVIM